MNRTAGRNPQSMPNARRARLRGFTLIEALLAIVVLSLCAASLSSSTANSLSRSSNASETAQVAILAQMFADEIALKEFDPATNPAVTPTPPLCARTTFNDVDDYNGYATTGICDIRGNALQVLTRYAVSIAVTPTSLFGAAQAKQVTIQVTGPTQTFSTAIWRVKPQ